VTTTAPTFPEPLTIRLTAAAATDVTVIVTAAGNSLQVANVVVPMGQTSAVVPVTALGQNANVTVSATLGGGPPKTAFVRVLGNAEAPSTVDLSPPTNSVSAGGMVQLTVTLDVPAPPGGSTVNLSVNPPAAGSLAPSVVVPANQTSASFGYTNVLAAGSATITAMLVGGGSDTATVSVFSGLDHIVISQTYGGGGNTGASFRNDFVELFNATNAAISLGGLSVQYASATGSSWAVAPLPAVIVPPGGYFLLQLRSNGAMGSVLPTPDATGTIDMSATNGKIALVDGTNALDKVCPTAGVIDLLGYGTANCFEDTVALPSAAATGHKRGMAGCADTDNNAADFTVGTPTPRTSATTAAPCM
jgi:hypothetical protein